MRLILIFLFFKCVYCKYGGHDLFTSIAQIVEAWREETIVVRDMEEIADGLENMAARFRKYIKSHRDTVPNDVEPNSDFVGHPINSYHLIRHLAMGWNDIRSKVLPLEKKIRPLFDKLHDREKNMLPDFEDIEGAAYGISRVISLYRINSTSFVEEGRVQATLGTWQTIFSEPSFQLLNAWDTYLISREAIRYRLYDAGIEMLMETKKKLEEEINTNNPFLGQERFETPIEHITEDMINNNLNVSIKIHDQILLKRGMYSISHKTFPYPLNPQMKKKKKFKKPYQFPKPIRTLEEMAIAKKEESIQERTEVQKELLCSGHHSFLTPEEKKDLRCFYSNNGNPWLKLAPIKTEILNMNPYVAAFREIVFENECDEITKFLGPFLDFPPSRMKLKSEKNDWTMKNVWPTEDSNIILEKMTRRVEAVLDIHAKSNRNESDHFMCGNYGIGGFYGTHPDFHDYDPEKFLEPGSRVNRISTLMMNLQAPKAGGATVFPFVGAAFYPEKGTGLAWYNLMDDGVPDELTRHAACPVLFGNKWIGNKWIGYTPQIHKKPCSLKPGGKLMGPLPPKNSQVF